MLQYHQLSIKSYEKRKKTFGKLGTYANHEILVVLHFFLYKKLILVPILSLSKTFH